MYEVLVFVYENYGGGDACPDRQQLGRRLSSAGFERGDILQALQWLDGLDCAADGICVPTEPDAPPASWPAAPDSLRVYSPREMDRLGASPDALVLDELCDDMGRRVAH